MTAVKTADSIQDEGANLIYLGSGNPRAHPQAHLGLDAQVDLGELAAMANIDRQPKLGASALASGPPAAEPTE